MDLWAALPAPWRPLLSEEGAAALSQVGVFLESEQRSGRGFQPGTERLFRSLQLCSPTEVRVVLTGQDPYPTAGVPTGLSFDVGPRAPLPPSLRNIFSEYCTDLELPAPSSGDLSPWARSGVLLLNTALSCQPGAAGSHTRCGWHEVTQALLTGLTTVNPNIVFLCWGAPALALIQKLPPVGRVIPCAHPSPLSAHRGFLGSRPFTRANSALLALGREAIDWRLP